MEVYIVILAEKGEDKNMVERVFDSLDKAMQYVDSKCPKARSWGCYALEDGFLWDRVGSDYYILKKEVD